MFSLCFQPCTSENDTANSLSADPAAKLSHNSGVCFGSEMNSADHVQSKNETGTKQLWLDRTGLVGEMLKTCAALMLCPQFSPATSVASLLFL